MYSLFSNPSRNYGGTLQDNVLRNVEQRTIEDIDRVTQYYRYGSFFTRSDHLLAKLINTVATPLSYELDRYYEVTLARALFTANSLQLTSAINKGKWFHGVFYYDCPEIIIAYNEFDNASELVKDWKNLCPVKVLECPISNFGYLIPNGTNQQTERGLVVIGVDIGMLMVMYRCFVENEQRLKAGQLTEAMQTTHHFVGRYVLPNMLKSQTDKALFNRLYNLHMGVPMGKPLKRHPIVTTDYTTMLDKGLDVYVKRLTDRRADYRNYLADLPRFYSDFPLSMPDLPETRQVWWALFLARVKATGFLLDIGGDIGMRSNLAYINELKITVKEFKSDGVYKQMLTPEMAQDMDYLFKHWSAL